MNVCLTCIPPFLTDYQNNVCVYICGLDLCADCNGTICNRCITGFILVNNSCLLFCGVDNCVICSNTTMFACVQCEIGYQLTTDGVACVTCFIPFCIQCNSNGGCDLCEGGLIYGNGQCTLCQVNNCFTCGFPNQCITCATGYSLNSYATSLNDQCIICPKSCTNCTSNGTCLSCLSPYSYDSNSVNQFCFLCSDPQCQACTSSNPGSCTQCNSGYSMLNGFC